MKIFALSLSLTASAIAGVFGLSLKADGDQNVKIEDVKQSVADLRTATAVSANDISYIKESLGRVEKSNQEILKALKK